MLLLSITASIQLLCLFLCAVDAKQKPTDFLLPNTYVIEFVKPVHEFANKRHLLSKRSIFYEQLDAYNISYTIRHEYDVINAVSIAFETPQDSELFFQKALGVKKAWPVNTVTLPKVYQDPNTNNDTIPSLFNFYNATGIFKVREELGITGNNIKVGIIDTGVDYTHPALGGCFGPGCRVAYGYDFVGDEYTGMNLPTPDADPMDNCNGHGTHVTGIIGAQDNELTFTGIAPEVTFGAYRIFGCSGSTSDDIIMKAMEQAYQDGMDVINLSLGDAGWPESPASLLADEFALKGMIVCAAAGNEGEKGIFQVGSPSLGKHALSVASVDNMYVLSHTIKLANGLTLGYTTGDGQLFNIDTAEIVAASDEFMADNDGCNPIDADVAGKVVLLNRGGCTFSDKMVNAQNAGAIGVLIYNNADGPVTPSVQGHDGLTINIGGITKDDGRLLFKYLERNPEERQVEFLRSDLSFAVPTAGTISVFSSWGLSPDLSLKPDLSAPGGQIYSTFPLNLGGYATLSGTSMASPYVSGIVALLQQARGGNRAISAQEIRSMLINNGHPFNVFKSDQLDSVARQGSGLIDVYQAVKSDTVVLPEQIRLSDAEHAAENHEYMITIKNNGRLATEYSLSHMVASAAKGFEQSTSNTKVVPLTKPIILSNHQVEAQVKIPNPAVTVEANSEANVTVRIVPPINSDSLAPSIYSGYILVTKSDEQEDVKYVPYAGITCSLSDLPVLFVNETVPSVMSERVTALSPAILALKLAEPSPLLTITVVDALDTTHSYGLIPGGYATYVGRNNIESLDDYHTIFWYGHVASTPEQAAISTYSHRNKLNTNVEYDDMKITAASTTTTTADMSRVGIKLNQGAYKLKVMALRPFGNPDIDSDYDIWLSPDFIIDV